MIRKDMHKKAEEAFQAYDFGVEISSNGAVFDGQHTIHRTIFIEKDQGDSEKAHFVVNFETCEIYAIDSKGNIFGHMPVEFSL